MRAVFALILLALLVLGAYAGYWFFAAGQIRGLVNDWALAREAEGWTVSRDDLDITGFPGGHRIEYTGLTVAAPEARGGWTLEGAALQVEAAAPWNFNAWTVRPRGTVRLRLGSGEEVALSAADSRLELASDGDAIDYFYAEAEAVSVASATAPLRGAERLFVEGEREAGAWRVRFEGRNARLAEGAFGEARNAFGGEVAVLALDLQANEEGLAALTAGFAGLEDVGDLTIHAAHLEWGPAQLAGEGSLGVDGGGRLRGTFDIAVADPAAFLGALAGAGVLDARTANVALAASSFFPRDEDDRILLPFGFENGQTKLGPVTVGPAPLIYDGAAP